MNWMFIISILIGAIGSICDILSSLNFQAYGLHEANPLMRDENKMFAAKRTDFNFADYGNRAIFRGIAKLESTGKRG